MRVLIGEINQKVTRFWVKCTVLRRECTLTHHYQGNIDFNTALSIRDVRGGAFSSGAGRGEDVLIKENITLFDFRWSS